MNAAQKRIERAYMRAMNIRDSTSGYVTEAVEERYRKAYRRAYRNKNADGFASETKLYLKAVRNASVPKRRACGHSTIGCCHHCKQCYACCNDKGCARVASSQEKYIFSETEDDAIYVRTENLERIKVERLEKWKKTIDIAVTAGMLAMEHETLNGGRKLSAHEFITSLKVAMRQAESEFMRGAVSQSTAEEEGK